MYICIAMSVCVGMYKNRIFCLQYFPFKLCEAHDSMCAPCKAHVRLM